MAPKYDVFISHAGEDKTALALFVYEGLKRRGISAFLDKEELRVAGDAVKDMDEAMSTALIGLFILSPEFALKEYPMLEVECFLKRVGLLGGGTEFTGAVRPELIPVFYRLTVAGCKYEEAFEKMKCDQVVKARFDERVGRGTASMEKILERLTKLSRFTGVENETGIGNDSTKEMKARREKLAENICDEVTRLLVCKARKSGSEEEDEEDWRVTFDIPQNPKEVILDFSSALKDERAQTYEAEMLRKVLRNEGGSPAFALFGEGGVGKSCILRGIASHEDVRKRFPGGVYFISLGMDASVDSLRLELLGTLRASGRKRVAEALRDEKGVDKILHEIGKLVGRGRSLVVLDDIWERNGITGTIVSDVSNVLSNKHGGMVLFTTRSASVASRGDDFLHVKRREAVSDVTRNILIKYARSSLQEIERDDLGWVVMKLQEVSGGLPVCLAVIGRGVGKLRVTERGRAWLMYWNKIRSNREDLLQGDVDRYKRLNTSLSVALATLEENDRLVKERGWSYSWNDMYRSFCVMKKQAVLPVCAMKRMWNLSGIDEVEVVLQEYSSVGLGEIVHEENKVEGFKLHDLLHEFAASMAKDKKESSIWHQRMLDGYIRRSRDGEVRAWWSVENDGYVYENICRHLRYSGGGAELVGVLLRVEWTNARLECGGLPAWKEDFSYCLAAIDVEDENERKMEKRNGLCLVRDVVVDCWPFIAANERAQLGFQMYGRLQEAKEWPVRKFLESVKEWQSALWLRPDRECWPRPRAGICGEIPLSDEPWALGLYGDPLHAVIGLAGGDLIVMNLEEKKIVKKLVGHQDTVCQVAVNNDEGRIVSFSWDNTVRQWDMNTGSEIGCEALNAPVVDEEDDENINSLVWGYCEPSFSRDCRMLVTGSQDGEVHLWDVESGKQAGQAMGGFEGKVSCVGISPDGSRVVAAGYDGSLRLWQLSMGTKELWVVPHSHETRAVCLSFSPDGRFVVSGGTEYENALRIWDSCTGEQTGMPLTGHARSVLSVTFSPDGKRVVCGSMDCNVLMWDVESGKQLGRPLAGHSSDIMAVAVSDDGKFVVSIACDLCLRVWDLQEAANRKEDRYTGDSRVGGLAASLDGNFYVSIHSRQAADAGYDVHVWDASSRKQVNSFTHLGEERVVSCEIDVSPDNQHLVCGCNEAIHMWDINSRVRVGKELRGHTSRVKSVAYSPDGRLIASGSWDKTARVWSVERHAQVGLCEGGARRAGVKRLRGQSWDIADTTAFGKEMVLEHNNNVSRVAFSPDGKKIFCGLWNGEIHVWEARSGKPVRTANAKHWNSNKEIYVRSDHVRSLDVDGREIRWEFDGEGGLIAIPDKDNGISLEEPANEDGRVPPRDGQVHCWDRLVRLGACGPVIAMLPAPTEANGWHYDSSRGMLVTGLLDGQVLFSQFC